MADRSLLWIGFSGFVLALLILDLGVFHRTAHKVSLREAAVWSVVWISLAMGFNGLIYYAWGTEKALEFLAGYLIEKSLSVDNIFVFVMIFSYFSVPAAYQHRVLFWGILGAVALRGVFIAAGAALLSAFHWMIYLFGAFLVVTGIRMIFSGDKQIDPDTNPAVRLLRRVMHVSTEYHGQKFVFRRDGKVWATPLLVVLIVVETTDVIFAVDSIPAIFAVTQDAFIVYTSNVFAILGLRALYFMLAGVIEMFRHLKIGLSFVLCFVGVKMVLADAYEIPIDISLAVIGAILAVSIIASMVPERRLESRQRLMRGLGRLPRSVAPMRLRRDWSRELVPCAFIAGVFLTLGAAKLASIRSGPSAGEAIVAIRVAQRELAHSRVTSGSGQGRAILDDAWTQLHERRYERAIESAQKVVALARLRRTQPYG